MGAIGPGDWVECINPWHYETITKGSVYRVREVFGDRVPCDECQAAIGIGLVEVSDPENGDYAWCGGCQFRPVYRPNQSIIEALKQPSPTLEPA